MKMLDLMHKKELLKDGKENKVMMAPEKGIEIAHYRRWFDMLGFTGLCDNYDVTKSEAEYLVQKSDMEDGGVKVVVEGKHTAEIVSWVDK